MAERELMILGDQIGRLIWGTVFCFAGVASCAMAVVRRIRGVRILVWLGVWSGMYGARMLLSSPPAVASLPRWAQSAAPFVDVVTDWSSPRTQAASRSAT